MKLCPQCEFIYEDDQVFCDMDGKELVYDASQRVFAPIASATVARFAVDRAASTITSAPVLTPNTTSSPLAPAATLPANNHPPSKWQWRGLAVVAVAAVVLVALLFLVYYARTHQSRTRNANRSSNQATSQPNSQSDSQPARAADTQSQAADSASESATPLTESVAAEQPPLQSSDQSAAEAGSPNVTPLTPQSSPASSASEKSLLRTRQISNPISATASTEANRASVLIRLTNGASIKADEAWEKKEGIWYRQAGMVTFLKRSRVRSIQRFAPATRGQTEPRSGASIAQNQPRVGKPETVSPKKESKVTSFLKKTGRILKKPFKL